MRAEVTDSFLVAQATFSNLASACAIVMDFKFSQIFHNLSYLVMRHSCLDDEGAINVTAEMKLCHL